MSDSRFVASYTATDLNKAGGKVLDSAGRGLVTVTRRGVEYVVLRKAQLEQMLNDARQDRPQSLDDLLRDYDPGKVKSLASGFLDGPPIGKEVL
jgi:hypothetical protein